MLPAKLAQQALYLKSVEWQATKKQTALDVGLKQLASGLKEPCISTLTPLQIGADTNNPSTFVSITLYSHAVLMKLFLVRREVEKKWTFV